MGIFLGLVLIASAQPYEAAVGEKVTAWLDGDPKQAVTATVLEIHGVGRMVKVDATGKKFYVLNKWVRAMGQTPVSTATPASRLSVNDANGNPIFYEPAIGETVMAMRNGDPNDVYECVVLSRYGKGSTVRTVQGGVEFVSPDRYTRPIAGAKPGPAAAEPVAQAKPVAAAKPAPAQVTGSGGLSGLYLRHEQSFQGTALAYREEHFYFFPDGRVYHGVPPEGPSLFNWDKEMREHPILCGKYGIQGNKISFAWTGGSSYTWPLKTQADGMEINMAPTNKVEAFGSNARLNGSFHRGTVFGPNYSYGSAPTITKAGIYNFSSNGSFSVDSTQGISGDSRDTGVTVSIDKTRGGTYQINGNDMVLNLGGEVKRCTVYPVTDNGTIKRLSIHGALFERAKQ